jgi:hypothetical protein
MAGLVVMALAASWFGGRMRGNSDAKREARESDNARADAIRDAADRARRADDSGAGAIDRLSAAGKIRD